MHYDLLRYVGFTNDQAIAILTVATDASCIGTDMDQNIAAKQMMKDIYDTHINELIEGGKKDE